MIIANINEFDFEKYEKLKGRYTITLQDDYYSLIDNKKTAYEDENEDAIITCEFRKNKQNHLIQQITKHFNVNMTTFEYHDYGKIIDETNILEYADQLFCEGIKND